MINLTSAEKLRQTQGRARLLRAPLRHALPARTRGVRCPVLRVAPGQRRRLEEIRDNLTARIAEAEREGWLGEAENLGVSLAHANDKLAQLDDRARRAATINLGIPTFGEITGRTASPPRPTRSTADLATAT